MSQQKLMIAVALFAGCIALASSQSFDVNQCTQTGQKLVSEYTQTMNEALNKFTSSLSEQGSSTFDAQKITSQVQEVMKEVSGLMNPNGFDFDKTMSTWTKVVRLQTSMVMQTFNPSVALSVGRSYMELLNTMMNTNANFATSMTTSCVPSLRNANRYD